MVVSYSSEKPNLSYVRINQNTSDGTGPSIKTYITKGLVSSDPYVVNANLLHSSLVAQPTVLRNVETSLWGTLELPNDLQDGPKDFAKSGGNISVDNRSDTMPAACAATSSGAPPKEVASARPEFKLPLTSVRLPVGAILVKINSQQSSLTNPSNSLPPTALSSLPSPSSPPSQPPSLLPPTPPSSPDSSPPSSLPSSTLSLSSTHSPLPSSAPNLYVRINQNKSNSTGPTIKAYITRGLVSLDPPSPPPSHSSLPPSPPPTTYSGRGIKRKSDEVDQVNFPQIAKISTQSQKLISLESRTDLIQENQRLERNNRILAAENLELREKLDLLSRILKDPRKRDMLNARLARMQTAG